MYKLRLSRPARSSHNASNTEGRSVTEHPSVSGPLQTIDRNHNSPSRSPMKKVRKASKIVMGIIDSPRRAFKKRIAGNENHQHGNIPIEFPDISDVNMESCHSVQSKRQNVLLWLEESAPHDILPKILAFTGPKKVRALMQVNKSWNAICDSEAVFRTLSEDYGKWVQSEQEDSTMMGQDDRFWKNYYSNNPIVPLDHSTIPIAAASCCRLETWGGRQYFQCDKNVRILVQPGLHVLEREVLVETVGNASFVVENHTKCSNSIEPMEFSSRPSTPSSVNSSNSSHSSSSSPARRRLNSGIRNLLSCRSFAGVEEEDHTELLGKLENLERATIVLTTKRKDCPIFHVREGYMRLVGLELIHCCGGTDIWNGNTAVQIQPRLDENYRPLLPRRSSQIPTAFVKECRIMSASGRGIVTIDGSRALVQDCHIHRCAATGIYIGGNGSVAKIYNCDIVNNGIGNQVARRGIARGHSGVYLEQGAALLSDCNISHNALTGVSAVSPNNAILKLENSDLVGNASHQLEMPPQGSVSYRKSSEENNTIEQDGTMRVRSKFKVEEEMI